MKKLAATLLLALFLAMPVLAADDGPVAYLTETVIADYNQDGTNRTALSMKGEVEIMVPNTADVLQYIRVNLTNSIFDLGVATTLVTNTTYLDFAESSGGTTDLTKMYANTSVAGTTDYNITSADAGRPLELNATVTNYQGGRDVYSSDNIEAGLWGPGNNTMQFWVTLRNPSSANGVNPVTLTVKLKNCTVINSFNQTTDSGSANGSVSLSQTGNIGTITVAGIQLGTSGWLTLHFNGSIVEGNEVNGKATSFDLDAYITDDNDAGGDTISTDVGVFADYSNSTGSISATSLAGLLARGPISQGVEMAPSATGLWDVRGFIENIGDGTPSLNYTLSSWSMYEVNETGDPNSTAAATGTTVAINSVAYGSLINTDGRGYTTWFSTGTASKPFYAPEFVWEVKWNGTNAADARQISSSINASMDFDNLKVIDATVDKQIDSAADLAANEQGINILVREYVQHTGQATLNVSWINIVSEVPYETTGSRETLWTINTSTITVTYENADAVSNVTLIMSGDNATNNSLNPASGAKGYVNITIEDLSKTAAGQNMSVNDKIWLEYYIISPGTQEIGDAWSFYGNASLSTVYNSVGTPTREENNGTLALAEKKLVAYKNIKSVSTAQPNNVSVTIVLNVTDSSGGGTGIAGIKFIDYVPFGAVFNESDVNIRFFNASQGGWDWNETYGAGTGSNVTITYVGNVTLPDGLAVHQYLYNSSGTADWTLMNNDVLWVNYTFNVTEEGLYSLPTIFAAFDPDTGESIETRAFAAIVVSLPEASLALSVSERDLELSQFISVEKPVSWRKDFVIYNPNLKGVPGEFSTEIFMDTLKVHITYFDEFGEEHKEDVRYVSDGDRRYIKWGSSLNPLETRNYVITILTPPVIETNKEVVGDVEEIGEDSVRIKLDIYLKNTAEEDYENVRLHLRTAYDKIESVTEKGKDINYWGSGEDTTIVEIKEFKAGELKALRVTYIGSYPIIIVKTDRDEYQTGAPVGMTIMIINGGENVGKPYYQTEVYDPNGNIVRSIVTEGRSLKRLEKEELSQEFTVPKGSLTGLYAANVRFREDYAILATGTANFQVSGVSETLQTLSYIVLIASTLVVLVFSYQRVRRIQGGPVKPATRKL